jgi:hypothetical protein
VDQGWAAIIGALVGGGIVFVGQWLQRSSEERHRFAADKRATYGAFLAATERCHRQAMEAVVARKHSPQSRSDRATMLDYHDLVHRVSHSFEDLRLVAPDSVRKAGGEVREATLVLAAFAIHDREDVSWEDAVTLWVRFRNDFLQAARLDLGVRDDSAY